MSPAVRPRSAVVTLAPTRHEYIVNLTGVANAQQLSVNLNNVQDNMGNRAPSITGIVKVLVGDTNGDSFVNAGDALQTRNRSGQGANANTFRSDVNADGIMNSGDTIAVRSRSGTSLP